MGSYHDLVADRIACGEKRYTVFLGECLDQLVFTEIGFAFQLNLMVNREDRLRRVFDSRGIHRPVLVNHAFQRVKSVQNQRVPGALT